MRNLQTDVCVVWEENHKTASDIQARSSMARALEKLGRNPKVKEKNQRSDEKPKLDYARRLRGICFIDLEDKYHETIKNARKKLETPMDPSMLCRI